MKNELLKIGLKTLGFLVFYAILLRIMNHTGMVAKVFAPGDHLPFHVSISLLVFIFTRAYFVLLPGFLLTHIALAWLHQHQKKPLTKDNLP